MRKTIETDQRADVREYYARRRVWVEKPHIRLVYERWVGKMRPLLPGRGPILEVGSGSGLLRDFLPDVTLSDIMDLPWIDRVIDCMRLPFEDGSLGGVIGFDVLHHLSRPHLFLNETARVLRPGGRALFLEPYVTFFSFLGWSMHHEDICFSDYQSAKGQDTPWRGNLALANLVFKRDLKDWAALHPDFDIIHREFFSFFDFTCAGGFKSYACVPYRFFRRLVKMDDCLAALMPLIAFRVFVVLEKRSGK